MEWNGMEWNGMEWTGLEGWTEGGREGTRGEYPKPTGEDAYLRHSNRVRFVVCFADAIFDDFEHELACPFASFHFMPANDDARGVAHIALHHTPFHILPANDDRSGVAPIALQHTYPNSARKRC